MSHAPFIPAYCNLALAIIKEEASSVSHVLDIFQRAANGPVDLTPKLAPGRAEREGLVSNLCISHSSEQTNISFTMLCQRTHQKSIPKPGLENRC